MKEGRKKRSEQDWTCNQRVGELKWEWDPQIRAIVWDRRETFELLESAASHLGQSEWSDNHTNNACHSPTYRRQGHKYPGMCDDWELEHRGWRAIPGRGLLLTAGRQSKGMWMKRSKWGILLEESWEAMQIRQYCCIMCRGWSHHCSFSLRCQCQQLTNRGRSQRGRPFECLTC